MHKFNACHPVVGIVSNHMCVPSSKKREAISLISFLAILLRYGNGICQWRITSEMWCRCNLSNTLEVCGLAFHLIRRMFNEIQIKTGCSLGGVTSRSIGVQQLIKSATWQRYGEHVYHTTCTNRYLLRFILVFNWPLASTFVSNAFRCTLHDDLTCISLCIT